MMSSNSIRSRAKEGRMKICVARCFNLLSPGGEYGKALREVDRRRFQAGQTDRERPCALREGRPGLRGASSSRVREVHGEEVQRPASRNPEEAPSDGDTHLETIRRRWRQTSCAFAHHREIWSGRSRSGHLRRCAPGPRFPDGSGMGKRGAEGAVSQEGRLRRCGFRLCPNRARSGERPCLVEDVLQEGGERLPRLWLKISHLE